MKNTLLLILVAAYGSAGCKKRDDAASRIKASTNRPNTENVEQDERRNFINVYFNKSSETSVALRNNLANSHANLEDVLLRRIDQATGSIAIATYEFNLPRVVHALMVKASQGVPVRVVADAKNHDPDPEREERYTLHRLSLEMLMRGLDGKLGTADDAQVRSDGSMFIVSAGPGRTKVIKHMTQVRGAIRQGYPPTKLYKDLPDAATILPASPGGRFAQCDGSEKQAACILIHGESRRQGGERFGREQMHNKFFIIDGTFVLTGSWNFTATGLYGTDANMVQGILGGNQQHFAVVKSQKLARKVYLPEFNRMFGGEGPLAGVFHQRKAAIRASQSRTPEESFHDQVEAARIGRLMSQGLSRDEAQNGIVVGDARVRAFFSPGDGAIAELRRQIRGAKKSIFFSIFAWSDQSLVDEMRQKFEDAGGRRKAFEVKGVFDPGFFTAKWSANRDMLANLKGVNSIPSNDVFKTGTNVVSTLSIRGWKNAPKVCRAIIRSLRPGGRLEVDKGRKLHSKTVVFDDETVAMGSTNWSNNGDNINDENMILITSRRIANQFRQENEARYRESGGDRCDRRLPP